MKVRFNLNSGANVHSNHDTGWLDTLEDLGMDDGEWESMTEDEKYDYVAEYWNGMGYPEMFYEEEKDL
jgi:hypothetical protein